jgi:hypothetical protein
MVRADTSMKAPPGSSHVRAAASRQSSGTNERPEDGDAEERELLAGLFIHAADVGGPRRHSGWEGLRRPSLAEIHGDYMRRSPGLSRCRRAPSGANSDGLAVASAYAFTSAPRDASSPTRCATARSIGAPEVASACVAARAVCASRAFHRCTVRAGTCGRPPSDRDFGQPRKAGRAVLGGVERADLS